MESRFFECSIGGRSLIIESGKLAEEANAAVTVRYGETVVLVTLCFSPEVREGVDFLPLTVDYEERLYAAGKIPGGFIRREGRPSEAAILACRLTDRPIRPLIPKGWHNETQLVATVLSADQENDPDILAVIGSSAALSLSEVPFDGPVGVTRIGYINGELVLNPTLAQMDESLLDLVVASTSQAVAMLEAGCKEVSEDTLLRAIKFGHEANQAIIKLQEQLRQACGKPKREVSSAKTSAEVTSAIAPIVDAKLGRIMSDANKVIREELVSDLKRDAVQSLSGSLPEAEILSAIESKLKAEVRASILDRGQRFGGRSLTEVRPITCEVGLLPRTHGSALFTRGQTQVLSITTLGSAKQEQPLDGLGIEDKKRFMHHYNFPPFSSGEVKRLGSVGRREIGHGALAERALLPMLPKDVDFPYTIRVVSEVLSSSGSTSMASVCAGSLSLMDAGVPVKSAVSGIAMGLITGENGRYVILTDIEGWEDAYGDMDFKIAGTDKGITALQVDIKLEGISLEIVEKALTQGKDARLFILDKMRQTISTSRAELSRYAPRMTKIMIDPSKIGAVIGQGGKTIRSIIEATKTTIDINDDGSVVIGSTDEKAALKAIEMVEGLTKEIEVGEIYTGKVTRILDFGAMVEIKPGKEGLVHVSELADHRVERVEDAVKVGDGVTVKVIGVDNLGRVNLSRRAVFEKPSEGSGARAEGAPTADYPFRSGGGSTPQRGAYPPRDRPRRPEGERPFRRGGSSPRRHV